MGMYNELNNIKQAVENQALTAQEKSIKKYKIENNLLIKLEYFIIKYKKQDKDIYNLDIQDEIIQKTLYSCFGELLEDKENATINDFVDNYIIRENRIDKDYYYIYCMRHYLQCCRNIQNYENYKNKWQKQDDYKKQIAIEKWDLQRQKMQLQIDKEKQKINIQQQKEAERKRQIQAEQTQQAINIFIKICIISLKTMFYLMLLPFVIFGIVSLTSIGIASTTSKKRRF